MTRDSSVRKVATDRASRGQGRLRAPVDAVAEDQDGRVFPGHDGEGVGDRAAGVLGRVRVPLVEGHRLAGGSVVGPVPVSDPWKRKISLRNNSNFKTIIKSKGCHDICSKVYSGQRL